MKDVHEARRIACPACAEPNVSRDRCCRRCGSWLPMSDHAVSHHCEGPPPQPTAFDRWVEKLLAACFLLTPATQKRTLRCRFCNEAIEENARRCSHCREWLSHPTSYYP